MTISPDQVVNVLWLVWFISWTAAALWSSPAERRPPRRSEAVYRVLTTGGAMMLLAPHALWSWMGEVLWRPGTAVAWTLVAVTLCGLAFTWWARLALGRLWSGRVTRKADHEIVVAGPYRLVRHPIYSGLILALLAWAVMRGTVQVWIGAGLVMVGFFIKARVEEQFLREELGPQRYDSYARRVPMLVPLRSFASSLGARRFW